MTDTHHLVKTILIPQVAEMLMHDKDLSENEALHAIYNSPVAPLLEDDSMGLYGQSALYLYGLIENAWENPHTELATKFPAQTVSASLSGF